MTAHTLVTERPSLRTLRIGTALSVVITAVDVIGMLLLGLPNAPVAVNIITTVLAVATLVGAVGAWRGSVWGVWTVAVSRALSALPIVPILLAPDAPQDAIPLSVVIFVLTAIAIALLFIGRRRV